MASITTRSGKGSALSFTEMDANLNNLNNDKAESSDLSSNVTGKGASLVGIEDAGGVFTATTVEGALQEAYSAGSKSAYTAESTPDTLPSATGTDALAAGDGAVSSNTRSIAFGYQAAASQDSTIAVGDRATASGADSIAIGNITTATNTSAVGVGDNASASGFGSVAIGNLANASATYSISFGKSAAASSTGAIAAGEQSVASNLHAIALGTGTGSTGVRSISLGYGGQALADYALVVGDSASTSKQYSQAFGSNSTARRSAEVAININGSNNKDYHRGSVGWQGSTTSVSPTEIFLGGISGERFTLPSTNSAIGFEIVVKGFNTATNDVAMYKFTGAIKSIAGTTSFVGTPVKDTIAEDAAAADVSITADDTNDALAIQVTAATTDATSWSAQGFFVEFKL